MFTPPNRFVFFVFSYLHARGVPVPVSIGALPTSRAGVALCGCLGGVGTLKAWDHRGNGGVGTGVCSRTRIAVGIACLRVVACQMDRICSDIVHTCMLLTKNPPCRHGTLWVGSEGEGQLNPAGQGSHETLLPLLWYPRRQPTGGTWRGGREFGYSI